MYRRSIILIIVHISSIQSIFIDLPNGRIQGKESITLNNKTFYSFLQVPYAAPPIGNLRFKPPTAMPNWNGVLDATKNTKICYQVNRDVILESEDCLFLNIYTPSDNGNVGLPVIFYIHGGGFIQGACLDVLCGPEFLIEYDVVVVTVLYRLGPFGFLSTGDSVIPGNNGLKDQQFALKWINKNIHLFGGDPGKVTIVGNSAGAASAAYQLLNKNSDGLFRGAILESGSFLSPWSFQKNARSYAFKTAAFINSTFETNNVSGDLLDFLLNVSAKDLDDASYKVFQLETPENRQLSQGYFYAPVLESEDTEDAFITKHMYHELQSGNFVRVPVLIGINSEESIEDATDLDAFKDYVRNYDEHVEWLVPVSLNVDLEIERKAIGHLIKNMYTNGGKLENNLGAAVRYFSDTSFTRSIIKHAELQSKYTDVYFYQFSYDSVLGNIDVHVDGAESVAHTEELRYMWGTVFEGYDNRNITQFPADDILTHKRLLKIWTDFAKTLNPTPEKSELLENIEWPLVSERNIIYVDINVDLKIKSGPKRDSYVGWNMIYHIFGQCPFDTY